MESYIRGLAQTIYGKISVIMMFGGGGSLMLSQ